MAYPEIEPLEAKEIKNEAKKRNWKEKLAIIKRNMTVEPVLACYVVPGALSRLASQNLNLDKTCRVNKNYGEAVCSALIAREGNKYMEEELAVQELVAFMESWKNVLLTAIPSLIILFVGAWSDRTGKRKICILLPIIGELLVILSSILSAYYFYELPVEVTMFFEAFFPAVTGGWITTYMGAFAYISDVSSEDSRTFRIGVASLCLTAGTPVGSILSGVLLNHIGYYGVFLICSLLYIFSIVYGFYYIEDPKRPEMVEIESPGVRGFLKYFFNVQHVKDTLQVAFKKGPNQRRKKSILVLTTVVLIFGPNYGEFTVRYLFARYRFNWDALKYSFFSTFHVVVHCFGALVSISLFSHRLKWNDSVLGIISMVSKITGALATAFARNTTEIYIAVAIETFNATSFTALRSIFSKLCTSDELGKMTSVFNLMEVLTSMVFGPIFSWIYMLTLKRDAGTIYYISAMLTVPALMNFGWFYIQHRKSSKLEMKETACVDGKSDFQISIRKDVLLSSINVVVMTEDKIM